MNMMRKVTVFTTLALLGICMLSNAGAQIDTESLREITRAVKEMCLHPDRRGNYLKVEGEADAGVLLNIVGTNISGTIQHERWEGINQRVDQYQTDPRKCAIEVLPILIENLNLNKLSESSIEEVQNLLEAIIDEFYDGEINRSRFTNHLILEINRQRDFVFPMLRNAGIFEEVRSLGSQRDENGKHIYQFMAYHEELHFLWTISTNNKGIVDSLYVAPHSGR